MLILIHSETNDRTIASNLGRSEYSYYFVQRMFRPLLERLGRVVEVDAPEEEVDPLWRDATDRGEPCVFLCFNPPHKVPVGLECPTVPVFAWEFDTLPDEVWQNDERQDWVSRLQHWRHAIVHSQDTAGILRRRLGDGFEVSSIPAPVFDRLAAIRDRRGQNMSAAGRGRRMTISAPMIDSRDFDLEGFDRSVPMEERRERLASILDSRPAEQALTLDGVVYTTVANPFDGRKRAWDLLTHFVWAMRDRPDATLLLKTSHPNMLFTLACLLGEFVKLHPFACRIVIVHGFVPNETYAAMIEATDYVVNCSAAEGQCLPLMEFMSCGKPAIAPRNSALRDYIDDDNSFLVSCHPEPTIWPHDERQMLRATRGRIDMMSLARAFQDSFVVARMETGRYRAMSEAATESLRRHCSDAVTLERLGRALRRWSEETLDRRMAASAD